jgi:hypothetical protein
MPKISLDLRRIDFRSDQNTNLTAWRIDAETLFTTPTGRIVPYSCVVDTGASFSVLPFSLWHDCNLKWRPLGTQVLRHGGKAYEPLKWRRVNCSLGDTSVYLFDGQSNLQAGPFTVVGKFVNRRQLDPNLEMIAILGMNFLTDNDLELIVNGTGGGLAAQLIAP